MKSFYKHIKNKHIKRVLLILMGTWSIIISAFEIKAEDHVLFTIKRSKNADEVHYKLNIKGNNSIYFSNPILVYWLKKTENNQTEPLTWIQENYSYGIEYVEKYSNNVIFHLKALDKKILKLKKGEGSKYVVTTKIRNQEAELKSIFIQFDGGTFLKPEISHVKVSGVSINSGQIINEIIKP